MLGLVLYALCVLQSKFADISTFNFHLQGSGSQWSLTVHHEGSAIVQNVAKRYPMTQLHILAELQTQ